MNKDGCPTAAKQTSAHEAQPASKGDEQNSNSDGPGVIDNRSVVEAYFDALPCPSKNLRCFCLNIDTLESALADGYRLKEICDFHDCVYLELDHSTQPHSKHNLVFSLNALKKKDKPARVSRLREGNFKSVLQLVEETKDGDGTRNAGYLDQRRGFVAILLNYFFRMKLPLELSPFEFAQCCYDIHLYTSMVIHSDYISKYMLEHLAQLDKDTNLNKEQIKTLQELHKDIPLHGEKNADLKEFLLKKQEAFFPEYVAKFCSACDGDIRATVRSLLPSLTDKEIEFGPPKSPLRIRQKYEEYAQQELSKGAHVYGKFKDLFRASITYTAYLGVLEGWKKSGKLPSFASHKPGGGGNYQAYYVILNIKTLNVELKVVNSLASLKDSHDWYELKRNATIENLEDFIRRGILSSGAIRSEHSSS